MARPSARAILRSAVMALVLGGGLAIGLRYVVPTGAQEFTEPRPAPAFTHNKPVDWINSPPLTLGSIRGRVILFDVWTFDCWNCYRSFPWLKRVEETYGPQGLQVIGIHSPEFDHERDRVTVARKVKEFGLDHPVMIDNDFSYWNALGNRYWPTYYLIDRQGQLRASYVGEMHVGEARARALESKIDELLREPQVLPDP